jgi:hypothetical protein
MNHGLVVAALRGQLAALLPRADRLGLSESETWNVQVVVLLRELLQGLTRARGYSLEQLASGRLFRAVPGFQADARAPQREQLARELQAPPQPELVAGLPQLPIEAFGQLYESLLAARPSDAERNLRKRTGSYYTPDALTRVVVERAFAALDQARGPQMQPLRVVDPALGAGAFLMQAGREAARRSGHSLSAVVECELFGADVSPLAVAVAEASLWLLADDPALSLAAAGANLREGDSLCGPAAARALKRCGVDFAELSPEGFDIVLGNPPWVAFAGRATQPLPPELREHYRRTFAGFRGYPTLHALFVELAARLAPRGVVALLIPSPLADLAGYRPVRSVLAASHAPCEPLLELGQDAFESVTQPCFALVAAPRQKSEADPGRSLVLSERTRAASSAAELCTPQALERLSSLPRFPSQLFGEMGLQTSSAITRQLLYRGGTPPEDFSYALLEGRNIAEFAVKAPRLFLKPDRALLAQHRCRLRPVSEYARVKLVVRQTAAITIAAAHDGTPFRNSLLAGFELDEFPFELTLGLLNSTLYRALHLAARRDARQGAFPQVKIAHLRSLPAPRRSQHCQQIAALSAEASRRGLNAELRRALDAAVFSEFAISPGEADEIRAFVSARSPKAGLVVQLS